MFKGFYNLTSGMLTHGRHLDVISNNMTNIPTAGFKADRFTASTFGDTMWYLTGNKVKEYEELGQQSWITAPDQLYTDFTQGVPEETDLPLDFCIEGEGFFAIETQDGERYYTRNGSFSLDNEGYLWLSGFGQVLNTAGQPMRLVTDKIETDGMGSLYTEDGLYLGRIGVWRFEDNAVLEKNQLGFFVSDAEGDLTSPRIHQGLIERSNGDMVQLMAELIATQRAYQSVAEATKIYDEMVTKSTTEVGRL